MSKPWLRPSASAASSLQRPALLSRRVWLQPSASASSSKSSWLKPAASISENGSSGNTKPWLQPAASLPGLSRKRLRCGSTDTVRAVTRKRPRPCVEHTPPHKSSASSSMPAGSLSSCSGADSAPRPWLCPSVGKAVAHREARLEMSTALMATDVTDTPQIYDTRAANPNRLHKLFRSGPCIHGHDSWCKAKQLNVADVIEFSKLFHRLKRPCQGHLIATSYNSTGPLSVGSLGRLKSTAWYLLGARICVPALCAILGRTQRTLYNEVRRTVDKRLKSYSTVQRPAPQRQIVDQFFAELYMSAAEHLPTDDIESINSNIASDDWAVSRGLELDIPTLAATQWSPDSCIEQEALLSISPAHAPKRSLQHGRLSDLWWLFVAWWDAGDAVSGQRGKRPQWSTFWTAWSERWQYALHFRKASDHAQCDECWQYGQALARSSSSVQVKKEVADNWRQHLRDQYHDRMLYWSLRWLSRRRDRDVLTIIIDSMDKSKLAVGARVSVVSDRPVQLHVPNTDSDGVR